MTGVTRPRGMRRLVFAVMAVIVGMVGSSLVLLAADLYAHHRASRTAGLNIWGYRGPLAGRKAQGEVRVAFLGGSTMFGYGVLWEEAIPARVESELKSRLDARPPVRALNLAYNNEGAYSYLFTLRDYEWLEYDLVVLYEGYNDMGEAGPNTEVFRHNSAVFRLTGYFPILPLVLNEKAMALRAGGDLGAAYAAEGEPGKVVFRPPLTSRASAAALESVSRMADRVGAQVGRLTEPPSKIVTGTEQQCGRWAAYCESTLLAVRFARSKGKPVLLVGQPRRVSPHTEAHREQQQALRDHITREFNGDTQVHYVDFADLVPLGDTAWSYDTMHLTPEGNRRVGAALAETLVPLVQQVAARAR